MNTIPELAAEIKAPLTLPALAAAVHACRKTSIVAARLTALFPTDTAAELTAGLPDDLDIVADLLEKRASAFGIDADGIATALAAAGPVAQPTEASDGANILLDIESFLARFVAYPSEHCRVAHALWIAHTHLMSTWESTPRIAFLSPEPASGKTRALEVSELLVPRPAEAINATPAYLFRKVSDPDGAPTILFDEIDTIFGPKAKDNEEIRGILNAGHRRGAMAGRCVIRGKTVETEELPAYCAVAVAGLGALPDTILSRSVIVRMRRRAPGERIESFRRRLHVGDGHALRDRLVEWCQAIEPSLVGAYPEMPEGVEDRAADVWEALLTVADAAGGDWPARARVAAVALVALSQEASPSLGIRLLADLHAIFGDELVVRTEDILMRLSQIEEAPWGDLRGHPIDSRRLAAFLRPYGVHSKRIRQGDAVVRGYTRDDLHDPWLRYLPKRPEDGATSATPATPAEPVAHVAHSGHDCGVLL